MAQTPLDSDIRRLPLTVGLLAGLIVSLGAILATIVGVQSWIDDRIRTGVSGYSNELIFPRVERLESSNKRILILLESQHRDSEKQHEETTKMLEQILRQQ